MSIFTPNSYFRGSENRYLLRILAYTSMWSNSDFDFSTFLSLPQPHLKWVQKVKMSNLLFVKIFFSPTTKVEVKSWVADGLRKSLLGCGWVALLSTLLMCKIKGHRVAHVSGQGWGCIRVRVQSQSKLWKLLVCVVSVLTCWYGVGVSRWLTCCDGLLH